MAAAVAAAMAATITHSAGARPTSQSMSAQSDGRRWSVATGHHAMAAAAAAAVGGPSRGVTRRQTQQQNGDICVTLIPSSVSDAASTAVSRRYCSSRCDKSHLKSSYSTSKDVATLPT